MQSNLGTSKIQDVDNEVCETHSVMEEGSKLLQKPCQLVMIGPFMMNLGVE